MGWTSTALACVAMSWVACCTPRSAEAEKAQSCVTECGMLFEGEANGAVDCKSLQEAEDVSRKAYDDHLCSEDERFCLQNSCSPLFGYQIKAEDATAWTENGEAARIGETDVESKIMVIGRSSDWRHSSLPHEMVHVIQNGQPPADWIESDQESANGNGHAGWTDHFVYGTIQLIRTGAY